MRVVCMPYLNTLLRRDDEMPASIPGPRLFRMAHVERELLPVTYSTNPIRRYPQRREIGFHRDRAPLAESEVVLGGSSLVAMAFDGDPPRRVLLQHRRVLRRDCPGGVVQLGTVERKEHRLQRRVTVEVVERLIEDRVVGKRLSYRSRVFDALWRWRIRRHRRGLRPRNRWRLRTSRYFLLAARGGGGNRQDDRDNECRVLHASHSLSQVASPNSTTPASGCCLRV